MSGLQPEVVVSASLLTFCHIVVGYSHKSMLRCTMAEPELRVPAYEVRGHPYLHHSLT
jgi:hypothetical protein